MQVNENGVFSFEKPWKFSHPNVYPTTYFASRQMHVISPFWSDNDIRRNGTVRYAVIESTTTSTDAINILDEAKVFINERFVPDDRTFEPTWMVIAQWDQVHPHPHGDNSREGLSEEYLERVSLNTFRIIMLC